jgi:hypothetical protein
MTARSSVTNKSCDTSEGLLPQSEPIPATETCAKHGISLMLRRNDTTGEVVLACPYCDAQERGRGEDERKITEDAVGRPKKPN